MYVYLECIYFEAMCCYDGFVLGVHLLEESILKMCPYLVQRLLTLHSVIVQVMLRLRLVRMLCMVQELEIL